MIGPADFTITPEALAGDMPQAWRVTVAGLTLETTGADDDAPLEVSLSYAADQAPRCQVTVSAAVPAADGPAWEALDPEQDITVTVAAGYGTSPLVTMATLTLQAIDYDAATSTVDLRAVSYEQKLIDAATLAAPLEPPTGAALLIVAWALSAAGLVGPGGITLANPEGLIGPQNIDLESTTDLWDTAYAVVVAEGWRLYSPARDTGAGVLELRRAATGNEPPAITLATGPDSTVTSLSRSRDRAPYANQVSVVFEWTDAAGQDRTRAATATDHATASTGNLRRVVHRFNTAATQSMATAMADAALRKAKARRTTYRVEAINAFWLRPDMVADIIMPAAAEPEASVIARVDFTSRGVMTLETRAPDGVWTIADALAAYPTIAAHRAAFATIQDAAIGPTA